MPLKGRVGRHSKQGGRHCQNWVDDQQTVIALLNRIPANDGGASGGLSGKIGGRLVAGMSSDALYRAISRFEDKHFPGQGSGFVDPGGRMLTLMEQLAARSPGVPAAPANDTDADADPPAEPEEGPLDVLRRNLQDETIVGDLKDIDAVERANFQPLITMALRMIDSLQSQGLTKLGFRVVMFGRAHVTHFMVAYMDPNNPGTVKFSDLKSKDILGETRPLPEMRYGAPVDLFSDVTTEKMGALLLYDDGSCARIYPYRTAGIYGQGRPWGRTRDLRKPPKSP